MLLACIFMNAIVIFNAFLITFRGFKPVGLAESLICAFIIYVSQIILSEQALGIAGALTLENLIYLNLIIMFLTMFVFNRPVINPSIKDVRTNLGDLLKSKLLLLAISTITGFVVIKSSINLFNPPFGWDSLNYHFTFAVEWLKNRNLNIPITVFDDPSPSYYPINGSLFYLWLIMPFRSVFVADLGQLPFFALSFTATYALARKIGVSSPYSLFAASLFSLMPNYFKQLEIAYVDLMVCFYFLSALYFLLLLYEEFSLKNNILFGLSIGLLLGTKTVGLPYSLLLFMPYVFISFKEIKKAGFIRSRPQNRTFKGTDGVGPLSVSLQETSGFSPMSSIFLFIISVLFLGGYSYLRNYINTGNPLYPLNVELFGFRLLRGVMEPVIYRAHFKPEDYSLIKALFHEGLGVQTLFFTLPASLIAPVYIFVKNKSKKDYFLLYFSILPFLMYLTYRYVIPLANLRYLFAALSIGMVLAFFLIQKLRINKKAVTIIIFLCIVFPSLELSSYWELANSGLLTFALFYFLIKRQASILRFRPDVRALTLIALCCFLGLTLAQKFYIRNEYKRYVKMVEYSGFWPEATYAWEWLNNNTQSNNIAYAGRPVVYPLYGTGFKNNVYYVSVNKTDPAMPHYFSDSSYEWGYNFTSLHENLNEPNNYRGNADYNIWLVNLKRRNTDFIFIYSLHQTEKIEFPIEYYWAIEHPGEFKEVFSNNTIKIFKLIK